MVVAIGWFGGRTVFRAAEQAFWALNSMAVQPGYALCREADPTRCRTRAGALAERFAARAIAFGKRRRRRTDAVRASRCSSSGWSGPYTRWTAEFSDLLSPLQLVVPALANAAVILFGYCAAAAFVWGMADAAMDQPRDWSNFAR